MDGLAKGPRPATYGWQETAQPRAIRLSFREGRTGAGLAMLLAGSVFFVPLIASTLPDLIERRWASVATGLLFLGLPSAITFSVALVWLFNRTSITLTPSGADVASGPILSRRQAFTLAEVDTLAFELRLGGRPGRRSLWMTVRTDGGAVWRTSSPLRDADQVAFVRQRIVDGARIMRELGETAPAGYRDPAR